MRILKTLMATVAIAGFVSCIEAPEGCDGVSNQNPVLDLPAVPHKTVENG